MRSNEQAVAIALESAAGDGLVNAADATGCPDGSISCERAAGDGLHISLASGVKRMVATREGAAGYLIDDSLNGILRKHGDCIRTALGLELAAGNLLYKSARLKPQSLSIARFGGVNRAGLDFADLAIDVDSRLCALDSSTGNLGHGTAGAHRKAVAAAGEQVAAVHGELAATVNGHGGAGALDSEAVADGQTSIHADGPVDGKLISICLQCYVFACRYCSVGGLCMFLQRLNDRVSFRCCIDSLLQFNEFLSSSDYFIYVFVIMCVICSIICRHCRTFSYFLTR